MFFSLFVFIGPEPEQRTRTQSKGAGRQISYLIIIIKAVHQFQFYLEFGVTINYFILRLIKYLNLTNNKTWYGKKLYYYGSNKFFVFWQPYVQ